MVTREISTKMPIAIFGTLNTLPKRREEIDTVKLEGSVHAVVKELGQEPGADLLILGGEDIRLEELQRDGSDDANRPVSGSRVVREDDDIWG